MRSLIVSQIFGKIQLIHGYLGYFIKTGLRLSQSQLNEMS